MPCTLPELQQTLFAAVQGEGADLPVAWFAGDPSRAALGVSVHATTIRHARVRALRDVYPKTAAILGAAYRLRARSYLARLGRTRLDLQDLGAALPGFLRDCGEEYAAEVADVEWAMWEAARAADAQAIGWHLLGAAEFVELRVRLHPAAFLCPIPRHHVFGLAERDGDMLLVSRPLGQVAIRQVPAPAAILADLFRRPSPVGRAVAAAIVRTGASEEEIADAFGSLVSAGALVLAPEPGL